MRFILSFPPWNESPRQGSTSLGWDRRPVLGQSQTLPGAAVAGPAQPTCALCVPPCAAAVWGQGRGRMAPNSPLMKRRLGPYR